MRIVVQRVSSASVSIAGETVGSIGKGFLLLVGITHTDTKQEAEYMAKKVAQMRIFSDAEGKMNLSLADLAASGGLSGAGILSISQFTLYGDCRHGNRPSFVKAARPEQAEPLYDRFNTLLRERYGMSVQTGRFGADMQVSLVNDGPVTILLDND